MSTDRPNLDSLLTPRADLLRDGRPPRRRGRIALALLGFLVAVVALLWGGAWFLAGAGVAPGTHVLGVDIGGLSSAAAVHKLRVELGGRAAAPIDADVAGRRIVLDPHEAGLALDAEGTVAASGGRDWRPDRLIKAFRTQRDLAPVVSFDRAKFDATLRGLTAGVARPAQDGAVLFRGGRALPVTPVPGVAVDGARAAEVVRSAFLHSNSPVTLPVTTTAPAVSAGEVARAMRAFATPAMAAPVIAVAGTTRVTVTPAILAPALTMKADAAGRLQPALDSAVLAASLDRLAPSLRRAAVNARLTSVDYKPHVIASVPGRAVDPATLSAAFLRVLPRAGGRLVTLPLTAVAPTVTTQQILNLGVKEVTSTFTQNFPYAAYRVTNIGRAARYINGTVLLPGQTFSMNGTIRERTPANGYVVGTVINHGRFREELGGGVSTITTAMWTTAFYAGLERVEQRAHSFWITRYTAGLEATVAYRVLDLKFRNNTPYAVLISAETGNEHVTISMWSTKVWDKVVAGFGPRRHEVPYATIYDTKPDCVKQSGQNGFDITVSRNYYKGGARVKSESFGTHYNPAATVHCFAAPRPPTPTPVTPPTPPVTPTPGVSPKP